VALDCAALEYVSSSGLRTLLLTMRRLKAVNGSLAIGALCEQVRQVLEITGFAPHLAVHPTVKDAVRELAGGG
jgi:anti-anti-sigma factor